MAPNLDKSTKKRKFFFSQFFFEPKDYWDSILIMINGDRNSWTAKKKIVSPISNSHTLCKMADIQYAGHAILETTRYPWNSVFRSFCGHWLWIWHRIFWIQNGGPNMADIIFWKSNDFRGTLYCRAFGVADYEFDIGFPFVEMADPIWRT